jgi:hypothetical protein
VNRRDTIKKLALLSSGMIALPAWANGWHIHQLTGNSVFDFSEQQILSAAADAVIPAGNSIGALSVGVDKFLEKLFSDCYDADVQGNIKKQLNKLENLSVSIYGKSFAATDLLQRQDLLLKLSQGEQDEKDFFALLKAETIRGFSTSKEVLADHLNYKHIPGHYYGCVDVNTEISR